MSQVQKLLEYESKLITIPDTQRIQTQRINVTRNQSQKQNGNSNYADSLLQSLSNRKSKNNIKRDKYVSLFLENIKYEKEKIKKLTKFHLQLIYDKGSSLKHFRGKKQLTIRQYVEQQLMHKIRAYLMQLIMIFILYIQKIPLIQPGSVYKLIWDSTAILARFYYLFLIPIDIAWMDHSFIFHIYRLPSMICLFILISDLLLSLNTAYFQNGQKVVQKSKIVCNSVQRSFGLEWLSVIQIFIYFFIVDDSDQNSLTSAKTNYFYYAQLIFLVHYQTIANLIIYYEEGLNLPKKVSSILQLCKLITLLFYMIHIFSCLWYWVQLFIQFQVGDYSSTKYSKSWVIIAGMNDEEWDIQYLHSLYYSAVTMFTVGYGDVTPQTSIEKVICILFIFVSSIQLPYSVSTVGNILQSLSAYGEEKNHKLRIINTYMQNKKISSTLQLEIREYLSHFWTLKNMIDSKEQNEIISELSKDLREKLSSEANQKILNDCQLFQNRFSTKFKQKLIKLIESVQLQPEQQIDQSNQNALYFIEEGNIKICLDQMNSTLGVVPAGSSIGLINFVTGHKSQENFRSIGFSKVTILARDLFMKIIKDFPYDFEIFCQIRDKTLFDQTEQVFKSKCFSCQKENHKLIHCPLLHYNPNKEILLKRLIYPNVQMRSKFKRDSKARKHKRFSLKMRQLIEQASLVIQRENTEIAKFYFPPDLLQIDQENQSRKIKKSYLINTIGKKLEIYAEDEYQKFKFRKLVKKVMTINKLYPQFIRQTMDEFYLRETLIEKQKALQLLQQRLQRIQSLPIVYKNQEKPILQLIYQLEDRSYVDDDQFESVKNYKHYFRRNNQNLIKQAKPRFVEQNLIQRLTKYCLFPGLVIKQFNLNFLENDFKISV